MFIAFLTVTKVSPQTRAIINNEKLASQRSHGLLFILLFIFSPPDVTIIAVYLLIFSHNILYVNPYLVNSGIP